MIIKNRKSFTLVELIIVIAIIGVLSVSAFTIVTKWLGKSRDSRRLGEINQIAKGLQSYFVENGKYPTPDMNYITLTSGTNTIGYQGYVGSGVSRAIELNKITKDPMDEKYYTYTTNLQKYQLLAMLEGSGVVQVSYEGQGERGKEYAKNNLYNFYLFPFNFVYSVDYSQRYPYLVGDKLGVILANTGGNTNTPIQELYSATTFTGINIPTINTGIYTSYVDNTTILNGTGLLQMPIYTNESVVTPTTQAGGGGSSPVNSCASTAWVSNATYSTGTPTTTNQAWQNINSSNPCYFSCNGGYSWNGSSCQLLNNGSVQIAAGTNCNTIKQNYPSSSDGIYWIDPNGGSTSDSYQAHCDMTTDGGGLTLVGKESNIVSEGNIYYVKPTILDSIITVSSGLAVYYNGAGWYLDSSISVSYVYVKGYDGAGNYAGFEKIRFNGATKTEISTMLSKVPSTTLISSKAQVYNWITNSWNNFLVGHDASHIQFRMQYDGVHNAAGCNGNTDAYRLHWSTAALSSQIIRFDGYPYINGTPLGCGIQMTLMFYVK